jgi:hypothetical protein
MKRYLIFGAIGPLVGGFLMLLATTVDSGYWTDTSWSEIGKFLGAFVRTLQYSYLFGIVPMLMLGAIDDIIYHIKRISPVVRMLMLGPSALPPPRCSMARAGRMPVCCSLCSTASSAWCPRCCRPGWRTDMTRRRRVLRDVRGLSDGRRRCSAVTVTLCSGIRWSLLSRFDCQRRTVGLGKARQPVPTPINAHALLMVPPRLRFAHNCHRPRRRTIQLFQRRKD